jgi:phage protein D
MAVYSARPTVRVDTQAYPIVSELITGLELTESEGGMSALELRLTNIASNTEGGASLPFEDDRILRLGASLAVYSGDENDPQEIFRGKITGLEVAFSHDSTPELVVLAEDIFQQARMERRTKVYDNARLADLARALAGRLSLRPVITGCEANIGTQVQYNESDLAFLRRLLARYDGDLQVVGEEMHVSPRGDVRRGTLELELHSQLLRARVLADLAHQVTEVTVAGWDAQQGQAVHATSTGAHLGPGQGRTGADILQQALGSRAHHLSHLVAATTDEAQALADTAFDQRARRLLCLEGTAEGNPALRVGTHVRVTGLGARFDNTYYVVRACHRYDLLKGYETDFVAECAYWGGR